MAKLVEINKIQAGAVGEHAPSQLQKRCKHWLKTHPPEQPVTEEELQKLKALLDESAAIGEPAYALTGELYCRYHNLASKMGEPADQQPQPSPLQIAIKNRAPISIPLELPARKPGELGNEIKERLRTQFPLELPAEKPDLRTTDLDDISKTVKR
jgi:hypothetical protein